MHELALCQALIAEVESVARSENACRVTSILVQIGRLSGVEPDLLERAYTLARAGTIAAAASLDIETVPVRIRCTECGAETDIETTRLLCRQCGSWRTRVIAGEELLLARVVLDRDVLH